MPQAPQGIYQVEAHLLRTIQDLRDSEAGVWVGGATATIEAATCDCGCEERLPLDHYAGFLPGHALAYAAALRRRWRGGDLDAYTELYRRGWVEGLSEVTTSRTNKSFGLEIEFFGISTEDAVEAIKSTGIPCEDDGYHKQARPFWRITEDGSVSGSGLEAVSPVMSMGRQAWQNISTVTHTLRDAGASIDRTCGLHVHHNALRKRPDEIASTVAAWTIFQPAINKLLPNSRQHNEYARPLQDISWAADILNKAATYGRLSQYAASWWGRYYAVNLAALSDHGTVEFRQHHGTLNDKKIEMWIKLTHCFMRVGKLLTPQFLMERHKDFATESVLSMLSIVKAPTRVTSYYTKREKSLQVSGVADREEAIEQAAGPVYCAYCDTPHNEPVSNDYDISCC